MKYTYIVFYVYIDAHIIDNLQDWVPTGFRSGFLAGDQYSGLQKEKAPHRIGEVRCMGAVDLCRTVANIGFYHNHYLEKKELKRDKG